MKLSSGKIKSSFLPIVHFILRTNERKRNAENTSRRFRFDRSDLIERRVYVCAKGKLFCHVFTREWRGNEGRNEVRCWSCVALWTRLLSQLWFNGVPCHQKSVLNLWRNLHSYSPCRSKVFIGWLGEFQRQNYLVHYLLPFPPLP